MLSPTAEDSNPCVAPVAVADGAAACETSVTTCDTGSTHSRADSPSHDRVPGDEAAAVVALAAAGGCDAITVEELFAGMQERISDSILQLHEMEREIELECLHLSDDAVMPCQEAISCLDE